MVQCASKRLLLYQTDQDTNFMRKIWANENRRRNQKYCLNLALIWIRCVCCGVLQCACCDVSRCAWKNAIVCCSVLQRVVQCGAVRCRLLQYVAVCVAVCRSVVQYGAMHCNGLQYVLQCIYLHFCRYCSLYYPLYYYPSDWQLMWPSIEVCTYLHSLLRINHFITDYTQHKKCSCKCTWFTHVLFANNSCRTAIFTTDDSLNSK